MAFLGVGWTERCDKDGWEQDFGNKFEVVNGRFPLAVLWFGHGASWHRGQWRRERQGRQR